MRESKYQTYIAQTVVFLAVLTFAMVFGSISDLSFSQRLYGGHETAMGQFFAAFGELPAFIAISGSAALIFMRRTRVHRSWNLLLGILSAAVFLGGIALAVHEATDNVPDLPKWVAVFVCTFVICLCSYLLVKYTKGFHSRKVFRYALTIFLVAFFTLLIVNVIKVPWGRVRMRFIYETGNESLFSPWWVFGNSMKDSLIAQGISKNEFRSCPSGHVACAACLFLLVILPSHKENSFMSWIRFAVAFVWTLLVSLSRIKMGAHFVTDVAISNIIFLAVEYVVVYFLCYRNRYFNSIWYYLCDHRNPLTKKKHHHQEPQ